MREKAPAIDNDPALIYDMQISPMRNGFDGRPMRFELVKFKERDSAPKRDQWDTAGELKAA